MNKRISSFTYGAKLLRIQDLTKVQVSNIRTVIFALLGIAMLRVWYRTFFDKEFVGIDRPISIKWSCEGISFRGVFFKIDVPLENVVEYKVAGLAHAKTLDIKVRTADGTVLRVQSVPQTSLTPCVHQSK